MLGVCHFIFGKISNYENDILELQGVISWRASGDRQISLSASDERAFANFRVKNVVFTGTHFCAVLSMVGERAFVNFRKFVNYVHIFAEVLSLLLAE